LEIGRGAAGANAAVVGCMGDETRESVEALWRTSAERSTSSLSISISISIAILPLALLPYLSSSFTKEKRKTFVYFQRSNAQSKFNEIGIFKMKRLFPPQGYPEVTPRKTHVARK
jgi:hypothetical protein